MLVKLLHIIFLGACCHLLPVVLQAQEVTNPTIEQQLENVSESENAETEDDSYQQQLQQLRRFPLNVNTATESDLQVFRWLTDLQIKNLLQYRAVLGKLLSIYELQAVPAWDIETISKTRPFITVADAVSLAEDAAKRLTGGDHTLLLRTGRVLEKSIGFTPKNDTVGPRYLGSPDRLYLRYKYQYKNLLQFGLVGDKDAGEQFFKGAQKSGFDFYSFHFFARNLGKVRRLALGDFTVNLAQGLLTYQSLAFRKSVDVLNIKRQTEIFRPYNSAGEYNFHRGAAITVGGEHLQVSAFVSYKKIDANAVVDSFTSDDYASSILTSGLHRTTSEIQDRLNIKQFAAGGRLQYRSERLQWGLNAVHYQLSKPLQKTNAPYNQYAFSGDKLTGFSTDYSYTFRNMHIFGEIAADQKRSMAQVHGLVASLDPRVDLAVFYRNIARDYFSINANAFTESTFPVNENGLYMGLSLRPWGMLRVDMYADMYRFPWLRFRVDRPSQGKDYLLQFTWKPNKQIELYTRYRFERKAINYTSAGLPYHETEDVARQNWRTQLSFKASPALTLRTRAEMVWYDAGGKYPEQGFLLFTDVLYKPLMSPLAITTRLQYFETDGYNSRIYAYENDVLYSYSIPQFSGKGYRAYLNLNYDFTKNMSAWFRIATTIYPAQSVVGSGYDLISGNRRSDYRLQFMFRL